MGPESADGREDAGAPLPSPDAELSPPAQGDRGTAQRGAGRPKGQQARTGTRTPGTSPAAAASKQPVNLPHCPARPRPPAPGALTRSSQK